MAHEPFGDPRIPPELTELHEALSQIEIEERPSFEAELREHLNQVHRAGPQMTPRVRVPLRAAAGIVLLIGAAVSVSPAGASLVRFVTSKVTDVAERIPATEEPAGEFETLLATQPYEKPAVLRPPPQQQLDLPDWASAEPSTRPQLLDPEEAKRIVRDEFPEDLLAWGIGGTVRVNLWVRPDGTVESPTIDSTSGVPDLDMAALRATRTLRFEPATRAGRAVGTWVEFDIEFRADTRQALGAGGESFINRPRR